MKKIFLIGTICLFASAQEPVASVEGEIRDSSGSALAGAAVSATNLDTGYALSQVTSPSGFYRLVQLPIGRYAVTVEKEGFARFRQQPVQLNVSQSVRLDVQLDLASQRESITVEGDAALVDTATNTLGKVVTTREVLDLPLNGATSRNWACCKPASRRCRPDFCRPGEACGPASRIR